MYPQSTSSFMIESRYLGSTRTAGVPRRFANVLTVTPWSDTMGFGTSRYRGSVNTRTMSFTRWSASLVSLGVLAAWAIRDSSLGTR